MFAGFPRPRAAGISLWRRLARQAVPVTERWMRPGYSAFEDWSASFSALGSQRQMPSASISRSTAFWMRSELLLSSHPSIIQAIEGTIKTANPDTVTRAFRAAARIVAAAASVLSVANSIFVVHS